MSPPRLSHADLARLGHPRSRAKGKPRRPPRREEAALLKLIGQYLSARGVWWERRNAGCLRDARGAPVRMGAPGSADVMLLLSGRAYFLELKSPRGRQRPSQAAWQRRVEAAGCVYWIVRDLPTLVALLAREGVTA